MEGPRVQIIFVMVVFSEERDQTSVAALYNREVHMMGILLWNIEVCLATAADKERNIIVRVERIREKTNY